MTVYHIQIGERLGRDWLEWIAPLELRYTRFGETLLVGALPDRAALERILVRLRRFGLTVVSVTYRLQADLDPES
jgi:hypothetical protein